MLRTHRVVGGEAGLADETETGLLHRCSGRRAVHRVSHLMSERTGCNWGGAPSGCLPGRPCLAKETQGSRLAGWSPDNAERNTEPLWYEGNTPPFARKPTPGIKVDWGDSPSKSPHPRLFLHVCARIPGLFWFSGRSGEKEPGSGSVQPGCRGCDVWSIPPMLCASSSATKRARGREGRKKELVRQERKLMAVFKKNDGGE